MACVACGGAGGVCEASSEVYERVRVCTDRKGGWGSGTYQPTSAVTPQQPWHQLSLLAPKRGTLDRLYNWLYLGSGTVRYSVYRYVVP